MLVCTYVRRWNTDMCTHCYVSLYMCSEERRWNQQSTWSMMEMGQKQRLCVTLPWVPHHAPASVPNLWHHPWHQAPTPGCGTRNSSSWLAMGMLKKWKSTVRECGALIRNVKRLKKSMFLWLVRREWKEREGRTPTELPGTPWTPEESRDSLHIHTCTHTQSKGQTRSVFAPCKRFSLCFRQEQYKKKREKKNSSKLPRCCSYIHYWVVWLCCFLLFKKHCLFFLSYKLIFGANQHYKLKCQYGESDLEAYGQQQHCFKSEETCVNIRSLGLIQPTPSQLSIEVHTEAALLLIQR